MTDLLSRLFLQIEPRSGSSDHYHLFTGRKHVLSPHDELYTLTILTFALIVPPCPPAFQFKLFASAASFFLLSSRNHSHTSASSVAFTSSHLTLPGGCQLSSLTRPLLLSPAPSSCSCLHNHDHDAASKQKEERLAPPFHKHISR